MKLRPNSEGLPDLDALTGDARLLEREMVIVDTAPAYEIDGIPLNDSQNYEYTLLLEDCLDDSALSKDVWRLMYFNDGDQWISMDNLSYLESDSNFMGSVEGTEAIEGY